MNLVHMFAVSRMLIYETWEKSMLSFMSDNLEVFAERYIFESL
jgi:hypothetical protein